MLLSLEFSIFNVVSSNLLRSCIDTSPKFSSSKSSSKLSNKSDSSCVKESLVISFSSCSWLVISIGAFLVLIAFNNTFSSSLFIPCESLRKQISLFNCDIFI